MARREAILARGKALQLRTLVARRQDYRNRNANSENNRAGTPEVYLNSAPDLSQNC